MYILHLKKPPQQTSCCCCTRHCFHGTAGSLLLHRSSSFPECFAAALCPSCAPLLRGRPRRAGHFLELLNRDAQLWPAKVRITHRLFTLPGPAVTFNLPFDSPVCPQPRSSSLTNRCGYGGGEGRGGLWPLSPHT